jgi:coenzyme F420-reducing hydrogenase beta subunit
MLQTKKVDSVLIVTAGEKLTTKSLLTNQEAHILSSQGSVYFKTFSLKIVDDIIAKLNLGERLCVIALPCQISALKHSLQGKNDQ